MKSFWVAAAIVGAIVLVVVVLNVGGPDGGPGDERDDVSVAQGENPPSDESVADIEQAVVRRNGDQIVFEVVMTDDIPKQVPDGSLEFRWDLSESGEKTWLVTANLSRQLTAAVISHDTGYGSSTIDDTMPGRVKADGKTLTLTLRSDGIRAFPSSFEWILTTTLDADLADPGSAVATDTAPNGGPGTLE